MVATKRRFNPNLQRVRMMLNGKATRAYVCTRCLKAGKVTKADLRPPRFAPSGDGLGRLRATVGLAHSLDVTLAARAVV